MLYLVCENCRQTVATFNPNDVKIPVKGGMFKSKFAERGEKPPWAPHLESDFMWCPICRKRVFHDPKPEKLLVTTCYGGEDASHIDIGGLFVDPFLFNLLLLLPVPAVPVPYRGNPFATVVPRGEGAEELRDLIRADDRAAADMEAKAWAEVERLTEPETNALSPCPHCGKADFKSPQGRGMHVKACKEKNE